MHSSPDRHKHMESWLLFTDKCSQPSITWQNNITTTREISLLSSSSGVRKIARWHSNAQKACRVMIDPCHKQTSAQCLEGNPNACVQQAASATKTQTQASSAGFLGSFSCKRCKNLQMPSMFMKSSYMPNKVMTKVVKVAFLSHAELVKNVASSIEETCTFAFAWWILLKLPVMKVILMLDQCMAGATFTWACKEGGDQRQSPIIIHLSCWIIVVLTLNSSHKIPFLPKIFSDLRRYQSRTKHYRQPLPKVCVQQFLYENVTQLYPYLVYRFVLNQG